MVKLLLGLDAPPSRTTPPTRSPSPSATCTPAAPARSARGRRPPPRHRARRRHAQLARLRGRQLAVIAHLARPPAREASNRLDRRRRRRRLRRAGAALDVLRRRRARRRGHAPHPHARARGRVRAVRVRDRAGAASFERLIAVSGIGPKLALSVLSGIEPADLDPRRSSSGDVARLTRIPGVGKKTAERMVLELRDRLPQARDAAGAGSGDRAGDGRATTSLSALVNLGYQRPRERPSTRSLKDAPPTRPSKTPAPRAAAAAR